MRQRRIALIVLASIVGTLALAALLAPPKEPQYQGRPLSYWLYLYTAARYHWPHAEGSQAWTRRDEAAEAVRTIGPAALPYLVRWIGYQPSPTKQRLIIFAGRFRRGWLARWMPESFTVDRAWLRAVSASDGFAIIGPAARSAVPDLLRHARHTRNPASAQQIVRALGSIGADGVLAFSEILTNLHASANPEAVAAAHSEAVLELSNMGTNALSAVPALVTCLADEDDALAIQAATALRCLRLRPDLVLPALTGRLQDPRPNIRITAAETLGSFGEPARLAVRPLMLLLHDPESDVREAATNALLEIAPEALTNAPSH